MMSNESGAFDEIPESELYNSDANGTNVHCPRCGNSQITFQREKVKTVTKRKSRKNYFRINLYIGGEGSGKSVSQSSYRTVAVCKSCGYTWDPNDQGTGQKRKTWLWVLGWIFVFPVPLTILLVRKRDMKPVFKYSLVAAAWIVYLLIGLSGMGDADSPVSTGSMTAGTYSDTSLSSLVPDSSGSQLAEDSVTSDKSPNSNVSTPSASSSAKTQTSSNKPAEEEKTYVLNTKTKTFHEPGCRTIKRMNEENKETYTGKRSELLRQGYDACDVCNP